MKLPLIVLQSLFGVLFFCLSYIPARGQMKIHFDFSNCDETIAFLKKEQVSDAEIDAMVSTAGVRSIVPASS